MLAPSTRLDLANGINPPLIHPAKFCCPAVLPGNETFILPQLTA
jgi:hypothetical protein